MISDSAPGLPCHCSTVDLILLIRPNLIDLQSSPIVWYRAPGITQAVDCPRRYQEWLALVSGETNDEEETGNKYRAFT